MTEQYVNAGIASLDKFVTIYSGMEVEPFLQPSRDPKLIREELGLKPEHVVIGKISRLFHLKGHEYVIQAAAEVVAEHPNVRFLFVGDGILRGQCETQIADAGLLFVRSPGSPQ